MMRPVVHLRSAGTSLAVDARGGTCNVIHWGADLGELSAGELLALADSAVPARLNATPDNAQRFTLLPSSVDAWSGRPATLFNHDNRELRARLSLISLVSEQTRASFRFRDNEQTVEVEVKLMLDAFGVLEFHRAVRNIGSLPLSVQRLDSALPVPARATELLDFTGRWIGERAPQRAPIRFGVHAREQRRGRTGHDAAYVTVVGTPGFRNRVGELWAMHTSWSGDQGSYVERPIDGSGAFSTVLSAGELLRDGEVTLPRGGEYVAPPTLYLWSGSGLDGISDRFHARLRARAQHPRLPRPLTLNTWEAVYLNHDLPTLLRLADRAAQVGVERFVLDDGWFAGRSTDRAGLGDWWVDPQRWPSGLHPLVDHVRGHGMQFGLWVEPEMISPDSETARNHPDWFLTPHDGWLSRSQHVLNVAHPDAAAYLFERLDSLIREYRVDFLKWDHNRDVLEVGAHDQTTAVYALLDRLRQVHRGLEIESCASGGGRIDLGILDRTDRVWASDTNDPLERQHIQRWTSLLVPPELLGAHVAAEQAHTTGRTSTFAFRAATALFTHAGLELDLTRSTDEELAALARFAETYREFRELVSTGQLVHADIEDSSVMLTGVVSPKRERAVFSWMQLYRSVAAQPGRTPIPGLEPSFDYQVTVRSDISAGDRGMSSGPPWFDAALEGPVQFSGSVLVHAGLPLPPLFPGSAAVLQFVRVQS